MSKRFRIGAIAFAIFLSLGAKDCPNIPAPQPTPTPTPVVVVPSPDPSPVCVGEGKCGCFVQPQAGEWAYICCAPWVDGGVLVGEKPSDCPEPPLSLCISPGSDYELQPQTPAPKDQLDALTTALVAETDCQPMTDCKLPTDPQTFMNRVIARLVAGGLCAGRQVEGGDSIAIGSQDDNWTYHIVNFGGPKVAWPPSKSEPPDHWKVKGVAAPVCPPVTRIDLAEKMYAQRSTDATPKTTGLENCNALGFTDRRECPLGIEGTPGRKECEIAAGPYTWSLNEVPCAYPLCWSLSDNPLLYATPFNGELKVCAANGFCTSRILQ